MRSHDMLVARLVGNAGPPLFRALISNPAAHLLVKFLLQAVLAGRIAKLPGVEEHFKNLCQVRAVELRSRLGTGLS